MSGSRLAILALACGVLATGMSAEAADELETLDEDFLSYLAEFEGDDDDWTIVETPAPLPPKTPVAAKPAVDSRPSSAAATSTTQPAAKPAQPAKPATPDDGSKR